MTVLTDHWSHKSESPVYGYATSSELEYVVPHQPMVPLNLREATVVPLVSDATDDASTARAAK